MAVTEKKKRRVGAPPKYQSPEDMQRVIDDYFERCAGRLLMDENGQPILNKFGAPVYVDQHPPTVTGLALALGFSSRQTLLNYQARPAFMDTVTRAKSRCEAYAEERLYDRDGSRGAQFSLEHNFNWRTSSAADSPNVQREDDPITKSLKEDAKGGLF